MGEIKASRSQPLLQTLLTQGPRGWGAYHVAQAEHAWREEGVIGKTSTWIPGTKGKVALLHEDLEALVLRTPHCATSNEYLSVGYQRRERKSDALYRQMASCPQLNCLF